MIELHQAFFWDCPECGTENFERAMKMDLPIDEKIKILKQMGYLESWQDSLPDGMEGDLLSHPDRVRCKDCKKFFSVETKNRGTEDEF